MEEKNNLCIIAGGKKEISYKMVELEIPLGSTNLWDNMRNYRLLDMREKPARSELEKKALVGDVQFMNGLIISDDCEGGLPIIEHPRLIVAYDGRIFIEEESLKNPGYIEEIKKMISISQGYLNNEDSVTRYKKSMLTNNHWASSKRIQTTQSSK